MDITFTATHTLSAQDIACLVVTAVEGGSNYWCKGFYLTFPSENELRKRIKEKWEGPWYAESSLYEGYYAITVLDEDGGEQLFTPETVKIGTEKLASSYPHVWSRIVDENYDADDADMWLQMITLGEIVYG